MKHLTLTLAGDYQPGDPRPTGGNYNQWCEWAKAQHKAGLKQRRCVRCGKWQYPQELTEATRISDKPFCLECERKGKP